MRIIVLILIVFMFSCNSQKHELKNFDQLEGSWIAISGEQQFIESWQIQNGRLIGDGFLLKNGDTLFGEKLIVEDVNGKLVYIADVKDQMPTMFSCVEHSDGFWKFENSEHDFPSTITYKLSKNKLQVTLKGHENNNEISEQLDFIKQ